MFLAVLLGAIGTAIALVGFIFAWAMSPAWDRSGIHSCLVVSAIPCTGSGENSPARAVPDPRVAGALAWLKKHSSKTVRDGMLRYAIPNDDALGVRMGDIQKLGKELGRDHALALELWKTGVYEARMLCAYVDEADKVTPRRWTARRVPSTTGRYATRCVLRCGCAPRMRSRRSASGPATATSS